AEPTEPEPVAVAVAEPQTTEPVAEPKKAKRSRAKKSTE
ncbi:unnamed protein product, partial [marine sediment metagenome]